MSGKAPEDAWRAYDANPSGVAEKERLADALYAAPMDVPAGRGAALRTLVEDASVNPALIAKAGWEHLWRDTGLLAGDPAGMAARLEDSALALALLRETYVAHRAAEAALTGVRRRMLLNDAWAATPKLSEALRRQAMHNGGAWLFEADERAALTNAAARAAYLPPRAHPTAPAFAEPLLAEPVTRAVADQYEAWPFPSWTRVMRRTPSSLAADIRRRDPDGPDAIPDPADILIAGCGTGRQAALSAARHPRDRLTAIDISRSSLAFAQARCAALGYGGIDFRLLDLHDVARLDKRFDAILCTGVLHHLPDPEAGWAALTAVLKPGGVMHVMLYSRVARMALQAYRRHLQDLAAGPIDDDVLREARRRILALPDTPRLSESWFTLAGVYDMLLHRHEDPFDVRRIRRAMESLGLALLHFAIPDRDVKAQYRAQHPGDPLRRDFAAWAALERRHPALYGGMYDFWCRKK
ncbi:MAG TPA: class I SAM-dependent methyltransferase [Rhizomicrobium sp.]|jgi:SAM-dependent methyltransferase|nr:class I SAM-dependent methyltransferase [Rhizomicrobium sp.]